ncbi:MAG: sulfite exporter TauE/SafE family protein [Sandaracinaceae bacterium]
MSLAVAVAAGAAAGLASSAHCAAMCGPLAAFAGRDARGATGYHAARLGGYALVGALAGGTGTLLADGISARWAGALTSWSLAIALMLTAWRLWAPDRGPRERLTTLGRRPKPSLTARIFARMPRHPAVVGGLTALLPCGALYAALLIAAGSGSVLGGTLSTVAFGVTSAIGLGVVSAAAARLRPRLAKAPLWVGRAFAAALLVGAVLLVVRPIESLRQDDPAAACH